MVEILSLSEFGLVLYVQTALMCSFSTRHLHLGGSLRRSIALRTVVNRKRGGGPEECGKWLLVSDRTTLDSRIIRCLPVVTHSFLSFVCLMVFRRLSAKSAKVSTERFFRKNAAHPGLYSSARHIYKISDALSGCGRCKLLATYDLIPQGYNEWRDKRIIGARRMH